MAEKSDKGYIKNKYFDSDVNANDLYYTNRVRKLEMEQLYDKMLERAIKAVIRSYNKGMSSLQYDIPMYNSSNANYDYISAICHIIRGLRQRNFYVRYVKPNCLLIDCSDIDANKEKMKEELFLEYEHRKTELLVQSNGHMAPKAKRNRDKNANEIIDSIDNIPLPLLLEYDNKPTVTHNKAIVKPTPTSTSTSKNVTIH
jgi:hypothetical protein